MEIMFLVTADHCWTRKLLTQWRIFGSIKINFSRFFSPPTRKSSYFIPKKEKRKVILCDIWTIIIRTTKDGEQSRERESCQYHKIIYSVLCRNKYYIMQSSTGMKTLSKASLDLPSLYRLISLFISDFFAFLCSWISLFPPLRGQHSWMTFPSLNSWWIASWQVTESL